MIIAVDFDGTLCGSAWPGIGAPRKGVIAYVISKKKSGARLILWTNRTGDLLQNALDWCMEQGIEFDAVNENLPEIVNKFGSDTRKIYADEFIDDKCVHPDTLDKRFRLRGRV